MVRERAAGSRGAGADEQAGVRNRKGVGHLGRKGLEPGKRQLTVQNPQERELRRLTGERHLDLADVGGCGRACARWELPVAVVDVALQQADHGALGGFVRDTQVGPAEVAHLRRPWQADQGVGASSGLQQGHHAGRVDGVERRGRAGLALRQAVDGPRAALTLQAGVEDLEVDATVRAVDAALHEPGVGGEGLVGHHQTVLDRDPQLVVGGVRFGFKPEQARVLAGLRGPLDPEGLLSRRHGRHDEGLALEAEGEAFLHGQRELRRVAAVAFRVAAAGRRDEQPLAPQRMAVLTIGPAGLQNLVEPVLQQRGHGVPLDRELQHDVVVREQALLFRSDVDEAVRVGVVEVVERDAFDPARRAEQCRVDAAGGEARMGEKDEGSRGRRAHAPSLAIVALSRWPSLAASGP